MIASYRPPKLVLVRNPHFREWSKAAQPDGYPDRLELGILSSSTAAVRAVEQERSDVAWTLIPPALEREVRTQYASQLHTNPVAGVTYLFFNTRIPPFDDVRARRAVNYAADRAAASRVSSRGPGGPPNCQILPPDFPGFQRYCPYTARANAAASWRGPDLERARRLVTASGTRGALVTLWVPENHAGEGPFTAKLLRSLGYRVRVQRVSIATIQNGPRGAWLRAHAGLFTWYADYPAASNYFEAFFPCESPFNWTGFCDRRVDMQIRRALELHTTDPYLANRLWSRLDRTIVDRAPVVPLFALKTVDFVSRRVGNYQYTPQWGVLLDQLWVR
jgi:peptide/nickel transport system substrate-binding protein